ncbi:hypothetical protein [Marinobacterium aestuariivivens]|uniref:Copper resistance protein n=1 Tax=Marinobacterium aestuariivivens TaxID=1698799 RepID=A0ABW2A8N7_9GAMM
MLMQQFRSRRKLIRPLLLLWLICSAALLCQALVPPAASAIALSTSALSDSTTLDADGCDHPLADQVSDCERQSDLSLPASLVLPLAVLSLLMAIFALPHLRRIAIPARAAGPFRFPPPPLRLLKCCYLN